MSEKLKRVMIVATCAGIAVCVFAGCETAKTTDGEKPLVTFSESIPEQANTGEGVRILYTATDNVGVVSEKVTIQKDDVDVTESVYNAESKTFTATEAGAYAVTVEVCDAAENRTAETVVILVNAAPATPVEPEKPDPDTEKPDPDTEKPVIEFDMGATLQAGVSMQVVYTATDNVGVVSENVAIEKDDADVTESVYNAATKAFTPTEAGEYIITVEARDKAGNAYVKSHTVTVLPDFSYKLPTDPNFGNEVAVHDPSVFYDGQTQKYYAFGSHFAVASSTDLMHWTQEAYDGDSGKQWFYGTTDFRSVLKRSDELMGGDQNTWAPDVEYIGGKYYMYYSLTSGFGTNKSVIGRVSADRVNGPYSNEEIIVWSTGSYGEPNCIDPELFYDKEGKLWMVYGSFFAGIHIKQLDANTGLPVAGENGEHDFGKLLWKGSGVGVEGPFIFYNAETDYYYLTVSDGDLSKNYNMRVARSKSPNGPYVDITGADVAVYGGGNKLAGNYQFADETVGYAALGHNSVIKVDGKYFVVYHNRYREGAGNGVTGWHNLHVNQLFFNADGWPVLSPNRYAGETLGKIDRAELVGKYDIVLHTKDTVVDFVTSERYTLAANGAVTKKYEKVGTWEISGDHYIAITIDGATYNGVIAPAWCVYGNQGILCFTAVSSSGRSLWANRTVRSTAVEGVNVLQQIEGEAKGTAIEKFDPSKGFAVSFWLSNVESDWRSATVTTVGRYEIHLPNLDAFHSTGVLAGTNVHPNGSIGDNWSAFVKNNCYVTVSVSRDEIAFYKNGELVISYPKTGGINKPNNGDHWSSDPYNVGTFIDLLLADVRESGFTFAAGVNAFDLVLSEAVTASQAAALYQVNLG